ncbi:MAG: acyltransferase [Burkholderiales bacterium]|nr:acyltransferase [Caldilineaceae bacterium]MCP5274248.1 acyltransferase [Burkholderiales bacterium]
MPKTEVATERNRELESSKTTAGFGLVSAHTGMRGLLAFYIMLFHALAFSVGWNLHGSALMPVFFLLAGYSLAIVYGTQPQQQQSRFNVKHYYCNRFARIAPVYYVAILIALPLAVFGRGWVPPSDIGWVFATNIFAVQMWASLPPSSFAGPAWTISTLAFFYLVFPWLLRWHQNQTDQSLNRWITILAVVQAVVFFGLALAIEPVDRWWAFWASHAWPISRVFVFDMGLVAGLLVLRQNRPDRDTTVSIMGVPTDQKNRWAQRVDWYAGTLVVFVIGLSILQVVGDIDVLGSWWMQGVFPYVILVVIAGLSMTSGGKKSYTQRLLNWPVCLFLGRISLALYLVHEPIIQYVAWITRPDQAWNFNMPMPLWGIAIVLPVSLALATLIERTIETPARNFIRARSRGL